MATDVRTPAEARDHRRRSRESGSSATFRPDVEGLRAVAVGLVLLYHAGLPFIPAGFVGVDVFFVISGFLITGLLVKELRRTGRISLTGFYARRAKRLLPAAAVVLVTTVVITFVFLPQTSWRQIGGDIVSSALYVVNWRLANRSVDYLAEDSAASPVQHYWSLAVEEQYYLVWPILILLVALIARRRGWSLSRSLPIGLAVVAVPSLVWSVYWTSHEAASAFFVTTTRMWELAIGAAVALAANRLLRMPRGLAIVLGWGGLVAIAVSALIYSTSSAWPGYAALLPTLGAAGVIAAGGAAGPAGPVALLGTPLFTWVGGLSYSLYLWHWPMVVGAAAYADGLTTWQGLLVVTLSVIPAWLTYKLVENPIRYSKRISQAPRRALAVGACLTAFGLVAGLVPVAIATARTAPSSEIDAEGAGVLDERASSTPTAGPTGIIPDPVAATEDVPDAYERGCQAGVTDTDPATCTYGDPDGKVTIAVAGDSKVLQWISAFDTIGEKHGWRVQTYTKSACPFADATISLDSEPYATCTEWNAAVTDKLLADPPDVVITSQRRVTALRDPDDPSQGGSRTAMIEGLHSRWAALTGAGSRVVVVRDNPSPPSGTPVYECVAEHRDDPDVCAFSRSEAERSSGDTLAEAAEGQPGVDLLDLDDYICPGDRCAPVIGNVLVWRQGSHITKTYVDTLTPLIDRALTPIIEVKRR